MTIALVEPESLLAVPGISWGVAETAVRYSGRDDLAVMLLEEGSRLACVQTNNRFCAAPVQVAREHLKSTQSVRALVVNAGNANAGTGQAGVQDAQKTCWALAEQLGCHSEQVLPFSTGVIAQSLDMKKLLAGLPNAMSHQSPDHWLSAARAIMTTDTVAKGCSRQCQIDEKTITVSGIAKGSGMIRPDMATMLAYFATDAEVEQKHLDALLKEAVDKSFHCITVDGDTSTNDACVLVATGQSGVSLSPESAGWDTFENAVVESFIEMAQAIVRDAEGVTRLVEISVDSAASEGDAKEVAITVAHSPLVKTAMFAGDPNWGRILAAVGRSNVSALDVSKISVYAGEVCLLRNGEPDPEYREAFGVAEFGKEEVRLRIDLGLGDAKAIVWTSDLSYEYIRINAEYRS